MIDDFPYTHRKWVPRLNIDPSNEAYKRFLRVTSYNLLADSLIEHTTAKDDYKTNEDLFWENRKKKIVSELKTLNSDIICCQEFERDEKFIEEMGRYGYDVAFKPRTGGIHCEGCAVFWKFEKFQVENLYCLEQTLNSDNRIYAKDNICIFTVLRHRLIENQIFIVANTHVLFNTNRGDTKLGQVLQISRSLEKLRQKYSSDKIGIIFTGDFNAIPCSGVYKFLTEGKLDCTGLEVKKISGQLSGLLSNYNLESNLKEFKKNLMRNNVFKFNEKANYLQSKNPERMDWVYDILSADVELSKEDCLQLIPVDTSKLPIRKTTEKIIECPIVFKSAYAENLRQVVQLCVLQSGNKQINPNNRLNWNLTHLEFLKGILAPNELDALEINSVEVRVSKIDLTFFLLFNSTNEPPNSFFAKNQMVNVDFIFYNGNLDVVASLNPPDLYKMLEMKGLPNKDFPSDHINMTVDFVINL